VSAGRAENSITSIEAAISAGYAIEIDLQVSSDGVAMVFHDYDLKRLTGLPGAIQQRSAQQLQEINLLGGHDKIPTFAQVLKHVAGRVPILVEIKDQDGAMGPNIGTLETAAAQDAQGYEGDIAFMSFNPHSVKCLTKLLPDIACGLTSSAFEAHHWTMLPKRVRERLRDIPDYNDVGACFVSHQASDLAHPRIAELKRDGANILCWTVKSEEAEHNARKIAENITFEGYPAALRA
jgi:glycerophosphoryl diester phosphodiesterase